jgi:anti-sigma B factor antagonist
MNLSIAETETNSTVRLAVRGEIDAANIGMLHDAVIATAAGHAPPTIILDFEDVSVIDSTGIGVLVACHKLAEVSGRSLRLENLTPFVRRQLFATGVLGLFGHTCAPPTDVLRPERPASD